jgi:hypothetical protein
MNSVNIKRHRLRKLFVRPRQPEPAAPDHHGDPCRALIAAALGMVTKEQAWPAEMVTTGNEAKAIPSRIIGDGGRSGDFASCPALF